MRNLKLTIRYDGTDFQGWQTQPKFRTGIWIESKITHLYPKRSVETRNDG